MCFCVRVRSTTVALWLLAFSILLGHGHWRELFLQRVVFRPVREASAITLFYVPPWVSADSSADIGDDAWPQGVVSGHPVL